MDCHNILSLLAEFRQLGIAEQIDYKKFYLYSIITHSTAIEGSTVTEIENQLLFDEGITSPNRTLQEQQMNLDLKAAYEKAFAMAMRHENLSVKMLCDLSAIVMKNTGSSYNTISGSFDASKGELRLVNVTAGFGGRSYMAWQKVPKALEEFCIWLNEKRKTVNADDIMAAYSLSFEAHLRLVSIHPWVDGNGRMSRLVMNCLQVEAGLIPTIVYKEHREGYIRALVDSRDNESLEPFIDFMTGELEYFLQQNISNYKKSLQEDDFPESSPESSQKQLKSSQKSSQKILRMLSEDGNITTQQLADRLGISRRAVANHIRKLQEQGLLRRVGADRGGYWEVLSGDRKV